MENKCFYKIKESFKEKFEEIILKFHLISRKELKTIFDKKLLNKISPASVVKKKREKIHNKKTKIYYEYTVESKSIHDYYIMMEPKIKENYNNKYKNYRKCLDKILECKNQDFNAEYGVMVQGKKVRNIKKLFGLLNSYLPVLRYYYNKTVGCVSSILFCSSGLYCLDIYTDRIIEGFIPNFDLFRGFYKPNSEGIMVKKFLDDLNKKLQNWINKKFDKHILFNK